MTGALKLTGAGRELLREVDLAARDGAWLLAGERHAELVAAADRGRMKWFRGSLSLSGPGC
jgi:hypothetical protein